MQSIYLDHAATTAVHPQVQEAMLPYFSDHYGNPSSLHVFGREAKIAISRARDEIAECLGCSPAEWVFTGSGTESDNMAIFGIASQYGKTTNKRHIITTQIEHHAVLHACRQLEHMGYEVTYLPVNKTGCVKLSDVASAIRPDTFLITIMYGNNEVGSIQPIRAIGAMARELGIVFHVDAVQALGTEDIQLSELPVDLMSFSAHKLYGPKGVGALYISRNISVEPLLLGGSQERKRRAGTENVPGIVGFAEAIKLAIANREENVRLLERLRAQLLAGIAEELDESDYVMNGSPYNRLPHILNVSFPGVATDTMLMNLDLNGIAAASGSACSAGSLEVSHVLRAMCLSDDITRSAIRFSVGTDNNEQQMKEVSHTIGTILRRIRNK